MTTRPRKQSESGFYHVFHRGVNRFNIFEDDIDREFYLKRLARYADRIGVEIHAWCLMTNHVHLLLRAHMNKVSALMRLLGSVYARHFNRRHGRTGPLFEGRFRSVGVETDAQLITTLRYIHRNPVHHQERELGDDYRWSSYGEYTSGISHLCIIDFCLSLFDSAEEFMRYHVEERDYEQLFDIENYGMVNDDEARKRAEFALERQGFEVGVSEIGALARDLREEAVLVMKRSIGCTMRQIQRLTALPYAVIREIVRSACETPPARSAHETPPAGKQFACRGPALKLPPLAANR